MRTRRYLVEGRVQGVFYRASARREAEALGLAGWVRNLADGRVEALACGDDAALERFGQWLAQGPPLAVVRRVIASDSDESLSGGFVVC